MIMILLDIPSTFDIWKWVSENFPTVVIIVGVFAVILIVLTIMKFTRFTRNLIYNIFHEKFFFILLAIGLTLLAILLARYNVI